MRRLSLADFVALYRGRTVSEAEIVALSAEPRLVRRFIAELLVESEPDEESEDAASSPAALELVPSGEE
jgi:hypothetical protein